MFTQAAQQSLQRIRSTQLSFLASRLTDRIHKSIPEPANNSTAIQQDLHIISILNISKKRIECDEIRAYVEEKSQIIKNLDLIDSLFFEKSTRDFQKDIWRNKLKNIFSVSVRFFATTHQNTRNRDRKSSFMEQLGSKENISQLTLTDIKNLAKDIPQGWLNDESIRGIYKKVYHQHFRDLIKFTHSDIYELEKLVFVFYWGQVFIDYQNKGEIWEIYMNLLTKDANDSRIDSRTIYTYCKTLNQIASTSHLNSSELREALTLLLELLENKRTLDEFYMRGVIFVLNTLLLQSELNYFSKEISQCLALVKTFTFTNEKVANMALFTLNNFRILVEEDEDLSQEVQACLDKVPLSKYIRRDVEDSNTQRKIANILLDMGFLIDENQIVGIYSVDFLLKPKLILEYHGGSHYYVNNQEMIQIHQVKVRVLKKMGYHVQVIPYYKWSILESKQRQESYLREIIYEPFYKLGQRA